MAGQIEFENRLHRLVNKHRAMTRGYTMRMQPDGLIVAQPRRTISPMSVRTVVIFLAVFILFKGFAMANLGSEEYNARVDQLHQGNLAEMVGGVAMAADPLSTLFADQIAPFFE